MSNPTPSPGALRIPQTAVAAAGRALKYTIADLTESVKRMGGNQVSRTLVEQEIMEMMDANKAMYSALPCQEDAETRAGELLAALKGLARGHPPCFCSVSIGHPLMSDHSERCQAARKAIAATEGREG